MNIGKWLFFIMVSAGLSVPVVQAAKKAKKRIKQVVIEEVTKIEGKIQKPEVWYLLPRSNLNVDELKLERNLVPKIEETIKKAPF